MGLLWEHLYQQAILNRQTLRRLHDQEFSFRLPSCTCLLRQPEALLQQSPCLLATATPFIALSISCTLLLSSAGLSSYFQIRSTDFVHHLLCTSKNTGKQDAYDNWNLHRSPTRWRCRYMHGLYPQCGWMAHQRGPQERSE